MDFRTDKKIIIFLIIAVLNILAFIAAGSMGYEKPARMVILDVGQGDATLIQAEGSNQILIDGGNGKKIMDKLGEYMPFYDHTIEMVIITHPDSDHAAGLIEVLKYYDVNEVMMTDFSCDTQICKELDKVISEKKIATRQPKFGLQINAGNQNIKVLYPWQDGSSSLKDDNDNSIVLKANINGKSILIMGDAGFQVENELIARKIDVRSDVLRVSHHGSKSATSPKFVQVVNPQKAIISVGENRYGHPSDAVLNRLLNAGIEVSRTDKTGDISIE